MFGCVVGKLGKLRQEILLHATKHPDVKFTPTLLNALTQMHFPDFDDTSQYSLLDCRRTEADIQLLIHQAQKAQPTTLELCATAAPTTTSAPIGVDNDDGELLESFSKARVRVTRLLTEGEHEVQSQLNPNSTQYLARDDNEPVDTRLKPLCTDPAKRKRKHSSFSYKDISPDLLQAEIRKTLFEDEDDTEVGVFRTHPQFGELKVSLLDSRDLETALLAQWPNLCASSGHYYHFFARTIKSTPFKDE